MSTTRVSRRLMIFRRTGVDLRKADFELYRGLAPFLPVGLVPYFRLARVARDCGDRIAMRNAAKTAAFLLRDMRQGAGMFRRAST